MTQKNNKWVVHKEKTDKIIEDNSFHVHFPSSIVRLCPNWTRAYYKLPCYQKIKCKFSDFFNFSSKIHIFLMKF